MYIRMCGLATFALRCGVKAVGVGHMGSLPKVTNLKTEMVVLCMGSVVIPDIRV